MESWGLTDVIPFRATCWFYWWQEAIYPGRLDPRQLGAKRASNECVVDGSTEDG